VECPSLSCPNPTRTAARGALPLPRRPAMVARAVRTAERCWRLARALAPNLPRRATGSGSRELLAPAPAPRVPTGRVPGPARRGISFASFEKKEGLALPRARDPEMRTCM
jgi:hypothetical protein